MAPACIKRLRSRSAKGHNNIFQYPVSGPFPAKVDCCKLKELLKYVKSRLCEKRGYAKRFEEIVLFSAIPVQRVRDMDICCEETLFWIRKKRHHSWYLDNNERRLVPEHLKSILREYEVADRGHSVFELNEATVRIRLDAILSSILAIKKQEELSQRTQRSPNAIRVQSAHWKSRHMLEKLYKNNSLYILLTGMVDYSLWHLYGDKPGAEDTNLLVVISKRDAKLSTYGQVLTYMAMIHYAQKIAGREDTTIFGIATDGYYWWFLRLDSDSTYARYIAHWDTDEGATQVVSYLYRIIDQAIYSVPDGEELAYTPPV